MPNYSPVSTFKNDIMRRRIITSIRDDLIAGNIDLALFQDALSSWEYTETATAISHLRAITAREIPPRDHPAWNIFNDLVWIDMVRIRGLLE